MVLAVVFTVLTAAPAVATVECRHQMKACGHCLKATKDARPQAKGECCFVKTPAERERIAPAADVPPPLELALAIDQFLPEPVGPAGRCLGVASWVDPGPPPLQRTEPLLH
jgi:hypothetical protein